MEAVAIEVEVPPAPVEREITGLMAASRQCPKCEGPAAPVYIFGGTVFSHHRCLDDGCRWFFRGEPN